MIQCQCCGRRCSLHSVKIADNKIRNTVLNHLFSLVTNVTSVAVFEQSSTKLFDYLKSHDLDDFADYLQNNYFNSDERKAEWSAYGRSDCRSHTNNISEAFNWWLKRVLQKSLCNRRCDPLIAVLLPRVVGELRQGHLLSKITIKFESERAKKNSNMHTRGKDWLEKFGTIENAKRSLQWAADGLSVVMKSFTSEETYTVLLMSNTCELRCSVRCQFPRCRRLCQCMLSCNCHCQYWGLQYSCKHEHFIAMLHHDKVTTNRPRSIYPTLPQSVVNGRHQRGTQGQFQR